jgi:hypothetical protein
MFPLVLVVFSVGQNVLDVNPLGGIDNCHNQAVVVPFDVEDGEIPDCFGRRIVSLNLNQVLPLGFTGDSVPTE